METALRFDSTNKRLGFFVKENFTTEDSVAVTVTGHLDTTAGHASGEVTVRKRFYPDFLTKLDVGAKYATATGDVMFGLSAKRTFELSEEGLTTVDIKGKSFYFRGERRRVDRVQVELSQKIFNITDGQDLKLKVGYDILKRKTYAQIRENNWTLNTDLKGNWAVFYDL